MELYFLLLLLFHIFDACKMLLCTCSLRFIMYHKPPVCSAGDEHWAMWLWVVAAPVHTLTRVHRAPHCHQHFAVSGVKLFPRLMGGQ